MLTGDAHQDTKTSARATTLAEELRAVASASLEQTHPPVEADDLISVSASPPPPLILLLNFKIQERHEMNLLVFWGPSPLEGSLLPKL